jgi:Spy/CpxP family protein refolding chaperone
MKLIRTIGLGLLVATASVGAGAAVAAAATTSTNATTTAATTPAPGGKHWHHRGGGMLVGVLLRATHQLNLTAEQESTIKGLLSTAHAQRKAAAGAASFDRFALANPGDPSYATALQNAKTAAATRLQNEVELQGQIYNVLTADQKAKLPQVLADMKSKAEARRAAWQAQHEAGSSAAAGSN